MNKLRDEERDEGEMEREIRNARLIRCLAANMIPHCVSPHFCVTSLEFPHLSFSWPTAQAATTERPSAGPTSIDLVCLGSLLMLRLVYTYARHLSTRGGPKISNPNVKRMNEPDNQGSQDASNDERKSRGV